MKELFKNKFRTQTIRARWWDYSGDGHYFITIITANRIQYFGKNGINEINFIVQHRPA